ncbi:MAG: hypothetical protein LBE34_12740 [Flavobacteriaceae bacterium]|jgi:hypothetical protein|nr:hypothetical protein [Flavobacteriaceae bacterium]
MTIQERIFRNALKGSKKYFDEYADEVLEIVTNEEIKDYVFWEFYLIEKDDAYECCGLEHLEDANESDLLNALENLGVKLHGENIISDDLVHRFIKILRVDNPLKIQAIIEQLERENNL